LAAEGKPVALVGASAGAAAVITAYAARRESVVGCVLICGKVNRPEAIGERYRIGAPAFVTCAYACQQALTILSEQERSRIVSRYALVDEIVARQDSYIPGAHNQRLPSIGHAITIALQITVGAPGFLRFLKRLNRTI
jgi:pimeloyl-ACP methyl ester carboxylesterase